MTTSQQPHMIYVWNSLGLWHSQAFDEGHRDPSVVFTSTDRPDALQQAGYDPDSVITRIVEDRRDEPFGSEEF